MDKLQEMCLVSHLHQMGENTIQSVRDNSGPYIKRLRIVFKNGYQLSIVQGEGIYNGASTFEIAIFNLEGYLDGSLFDEENQGDNLLDYCDLAKINHYILKIGNL